MKRGGLLGVALLGGCLSLERESPLVRSYAPSVQGPVVEARGRGALAMGRFEVSPRFARREFVYRQGDVRYEADFYHVFLAEPEVLLREECERWLRDAGLFAHVGPAAALPEADLRLEASVEALYGDYRDPASPRAVLSMRFRVRDAEGLRLDRGFAPEVPLADLERATLVRGWEEALRRILAALTAELRGAREFLPGPSEGGRSEAPVPLERRRSGGDNGRTVMVNAVFEALQDLLAGIAPGSAAAGTEPRALIRAASLKAAAVSGSLALPPGPLGTLTVLPDLVGVWRIQSRLVADLAACYGQSARVTRESLLYCLFKHSAAQALRDVAVRLARRLAARGAARWLPLAGALGVGAYAYFDTREVGRTAMDFFRRTQAA